MSRSRRAAPIPAAARVIAGTAAVLVALPFVGLLARVPWTDALDIATQADVRTALRLSLVCSLLAALAATVFGLPLAWWLAQATSRATGLVRALCTLSMVLPPVVAGVALFFALGRQGFVGQYLDRWFGLRLPFTTAGVVVAQTFVAFPFLVLTVEAALRQHDQRLDDAARTLGAGPWLTFRRVTLPAIRPALVAGLVLAWARALGEFGATVTFAGSFPGTTRTMPIAIYLAAQSDPQAALVLSVILVVVSFTVLLVLRDRVLGAVTRGGAAP